MDLFLWWGGVSLLWGIFVKEWMEQVKTNMLIAVFDF